MEPSLSCFFNLFFEVLKVTFYLQVFQDIGHRPSVVQVIPVPCLTPCSVYLPSPTPGLPNPQKTLVCFLCLPLLLFIICNSLLYCFGLLIYNYIWVYTCIYICGKIMQVLTYIWHSSIYMYAAAAAKSLQLCLTLCDPIDGSPPGAPSLGFSRQEHWSGLPFPSPMHESEKWKWSCSVVSDS